MVVPRVPGAPAVLDAPDDFRCWIQSGDLDPWSINEQRRRLSANRSGIEVFEVSAPINSPKLHVAIDRIHSISLGGSPSHPTNGGHLRKTADCPSYPPAVSGVSRGRWTMSSWASESLITTTSRR